MKNCYWISLFDEIIKACDENEPYTNLREYDCYRNIHATISIEDYMTRLEDNWNVDESSTFAIAAKLLHRFLRKTSCLIKYNNSHRLILSALTIATKWHEENYYSQDHYCSVGGVSKRELFALEVFFMKHLDYEIFVNDI